MIFYSMRPFHFFILVFLSVTFLTSGQKYNDAKADLHNKALEFYENKNIEDAYKAYHALTRRDSNDLEANYFEGMCLMLLDRPKDAVKPLFKAYHKKHKYKGSFNIVWNEDILDFTSDQVEWMLARAYHKTDQFAEAVKLYHQYEKKLKNKPFVTDDERQFIRHTSIQAQNGRLYSKNPVDSIKIKNMTWINSKDDEFSPFANAVKKDLVFSQMSIEKHVVDLFSINQNDTTSKTSFGPKWEEDIEPSILWMAPDGKSFLASETSWAGTEYHEYLLENDKWKRTNRLDFAQIWSGQILYAHVSLDRTTLILEVIERSGYGGSDLYVAYKNNDGSWGRPNNMGRVINSKWDESTPFLDPLTNDLYFSTTGRTSIGGFDIFVSKFDTTTNTWLHPSNLGYPINSAGDDFTFSPTLDRTKAYICSNRFTGKGGLDIYEIDYPAPKTETALLSGQVLSTFNATPVKANIDIINESQDTIRLLSDGFTGNFTEVLPITGSYEIHASAYGYKSGQMSLSFDGDSSFETKDIVMQLEPIIKPSKVNLANVLFVHNQADLLESSFSQLDSVAATLLDSNSYYIQIAGHTEPGGIETRNLELSQQRAEIVSAYLEKKGIASKRLDATGYGSKYPITRDKSAEERVKNRRTELIIYDIRVNPNFDSKAYDQEE